MRFLCAVAAALATTLAVADAQEFRPKPARAGATTQSSLAPPLPRPRPSVRGERERSAAAPAEQPPVPPPCLTALSAIAIVRAASVNQGACEVSDVVEMSAVMATGGGRVLITPPVVLRCAMAEAVAGWLREEVAAAVQAIGEQLHGVVSAASFECRPRNRIDGAKPSEHGKANALDIRALALTNGRILALTDIAADKTVRDALRRSACARFTTVLGPGSDGFHEHHVHVDFAERRNGYRLCQWDVRDATDVPVPRERPASAPPHMSSR